MIISVKCCSAHVDNSRCDQAGDQANVLGQLNWYRGVAGLPNVTANATKHSQAQAVVWAYILQRCITIELVDWSQQIRLANVSTLNPLFDVSGAYLYNYPQESTELISLHNHTSYPRAHTHTAARTRTRSRQTAVCCSHPINRV
jgi:hypothetical protein